MVAKISTSEDHTAWQIVVAVVCSCTSGRVADEINLGVLLDQTRWVDCSAFVRSLSLSFSTVAYDSNGASRLLVWPPLGVIHEYRPSIHVEVLRLPSTLSCFSGSYCFLLGVWERRNGRSVTSCHRCIEPYQALCLTTPLVTNWWLSWCFRCCSRS